MSQSSETIAAFRFGLGFSRVTENAYSANDLVQQTRDTDIGLSEFPGVPLKNRTELLRRYAKLNQERKKTGTRSQAFKEMSKRSRLLQLEDSQRIFNRAVFNPNSFFERLSFFWLDHFTVSPKSRTGQVVWGDYIDTAIRAHVGRSFADMLTAVVLHPNMLFYLDQRVSMGPNSKTGIRRKRGLNENLAREILELHTLGVRGTYSQKDVRQLAELLTGLTINRKGMVFDPNRSEPGPEQVLGRTYGDDGPAELVDIITFLHDVARHPDTARHIARKLAVHFVSDTPDPDLIAAMADTFTATEGDLPSVYGAMLDHPGAWVPLGGKAKQPLDFMISGLRALGVQRKDVAGISPRRAARSFITPLTVMGQPLRRAPGPNGWPEEAEAWITAQGLAARLQWSLIVSKRHGRAIDPREFVDFALRDLAGESLRFAVSGAEKRAEGLALVLASPEFNRR
ncbi:MAG: DUF1800 domain-containing protein [Pseudomonadota bacterium]